MARRRPFRIERHPVYVEIIPEPMFVCHVCGHTINVGDAVRIANARIGPGVGVIIVTACHSCGKWHLSVGGTEGVKVPYITRETSREETGSLVRGEPLVLEPGELMEEFVGIGAGI